MKIEGDYSDVLTYLANLFSIKKIRTISIDRFTISYSRCDIITDSTKGTSSVVDQIPGKDDVDRIRSLDLEVEGIDNSSVTITIGWDSVFSPSVTSKEKLEYFLEILDKSTFRYF